MHKKSQQNLTVAIYNIATSTATSLKNCCKVLSSCSTPQQIAEAHKLLGFVRTDNSVINSHLLSKLPNRSKDGDIHLLQTGSDAGTSSHPMALSNSLQVMCVSMAPDTHQDERSTQSLVLRCVSNTSEASDCEDNNEALQSGKVKIDEEWYLLWQVIRAVHIISMNFIQWNSHEHYSLEKLCNKVGVNVNHAQLMLAMKMAQPFEAAYSHNDETLVNNKAVPTTVKRENIVQESINRQNNRAQYEARRKELRLKIANNRTPFKRSTSVICGGALYEEKDGTVPTGWRVEYIKRHSSNHVDRYWYSVTNKKMRSRVEVRMFLDLIQKCNGDEESAWAKFPGKKKK